MPELPEVETTATGLNELIRGLKITDVWTDYGGDFHIGKEHIKNEGYFKKFRKIIAGRKIIEVSRRGKNVLIRLDNERTIIIHMKMTGHLLYGEYGRVESSKPARPNGHSGKSKVES